MSFVPDDEFERRERLNLAPMIDFLFLMLMFFASLAISRVAAKDTDISLVKVQPETKASLAKADTDKKVITISINSEGEYKWMTEFDDYHMINAAAVAHELEQQYQSGQLPEDKQKTQILLKIDKKATWDPILKLIFAIRDSGFDVHPVYEPDSSDSIAQR